MLRIPAMSAMILIISCTEVTADDLFVREESFSYMVEAGSDVIISNISGNIVIEECESAFLLIGYSIEGENSEEVEAIEIDCSQVNGVICEVEYCDGWNGPLEAMVDFHVCLPNSIELNLVLLTMNGCINLNSGSGTSLVEIINGSAILEGFSGELTVNVVSGEIELLDIDGLHIANIVDGTISGRIDSIERDIEISAVDGIVDLAIECPSIVSVTTLTGDLDIPGVEIVHELMGSYAEFGDGEFRIDISTYSGDVRIRR
jgi:DUF4097 and DUF4098 domain-containing protein YvlB